MAKPDILMLTPMRPLVEKTLAQHVTLHRFWDAPDKEKLLSDVGPRITGIVSFVASCPRSLIEKLPKLEIIATSAVGYDGIDVKAAAERGIVVTNTPDVLTDEVADLTLGLLLATVREIPRAEKYLRDGQWPKGPYHLTATLRGRKAGIIGLGRIGKAIAERLEGFGTQISYHGRRKQADVAYPYFPSVAELAKAVDVLIAIMPGGADTKHLIGAAEFEALGPNGIFINVARGSVVDETALIAALKSGKILAAGLDVFENEPNVPAELIALPNTVLLPHVASASVYTRDEMAQLAVDNLLAWLAGKPPLTPVPETPSPR
ncbi:glycerate dehydrogenase [Terrihabitans soli]|uniref:Glycerate dehydrogenase n=1 Tax=Terrihabitans soli TaxID=708113 RepID=A0A6S6QYA0_9HYPH|nr:2-hydroxyacid dehydrogenase [Terrihabitans soli]BCJ92252.1 glycerate dehydrogenase [Terrihabitans soli]